MKRTLQLLTPAFRNKNIDLNNMILKKGDYYTSFIGCAITSTPPPLLCQIANNAPQFPQLCFTSFRFVKKYGTHPRQQVAHVRAAHKLFQFISIHSKHITGEREKNILCKVPALNTNICHSPSPTKRTIYRCCSPRQRCKRHGRQELAVFVRACSPQWRL